MPISVSYVSVTCMNYQPRGWALFAFVFLYLPTEQILSFYDYSDMSTDRLILSDVHLKGINGRRA